MRCLCVLRIECVSFFFFNCQKSILKAIKLSWNLRRVPVGRRNFLPIFSREQGKKTRAKIVPATEDITLGLSVDRLRWCARAHALCVSRTCEHLRMCMHVHTNVHFVGHTCPHTHPKKSKKLLKFWTFWTLSLSSWSTVRLQIMHPAKAMNDQYEQIRYIYAYSSRRLNLPRRRRDEHLVKKEWQMLSWWTQGETSTNRVFGTLQTHR